MRQPPDVLLVEDNLLDVELAKAAFHRLGIRVNLDHAVDGIDALQKLQPRTKGGGPLPDLILLDINLPRMDGRELLRAIKADPRLRRLPVIVLTSSKNETDVQQMYDLQASCYLVKPLEFAAFLELAKALDQFWFQHVERPPRAGGAR